MKKIRDIETSTIAQCLRTGSVYIVDNFLEQTELLALRDEVIYMESEGLLRPATISKGLKNVANQSSRGDCCVFLKMNQPKQSPRRTENLKNDESKANFEENSEDIAQFDTQEPARDEQIQCYLQAMDGLRQHLEEELNLGMEKTSFMAAIYPGDGSGYVRHRDSNPDCPGRKVTAILYLNDSWEESDGGELMVYSDDNEEEDRAATRVLPIGGRLVLFRSSLEHEVLPCFKKRVAITAWFYNKKHMAIELLCEQLQS